MDFSRHQLTAARDAARLWLLYGLAVVGVVAAFNAGCWSAWRAFFPEAALPTGFWAVNIGATAGLILGGSLIEWHRLEHDPARIADRLGATPIVAGAALANAAERRLVNVVEEMALAARQPIPRIYVLARDPQINALVTGMRREDAAVIVTAGALERLDRAELQGLVAHELAHVASGDVAINTRLAALTAGLELVSDAGRRAIGLTHGPRARRDDHPLFLPALVLYLPGLLLCACGLAGHLAARLLVAAISRNREFHADALAVQLTREPLGLGRALRKVLWLETQPDAAASPLASLPGLQQSLFQGATHWPAWLESHPPLAERIERLLGRRAGPLPSHPKPIADLPPAAPDGIADEAGATALWLARHSLPPLVYAAPGQAPRATGDDLAELAQAAHDASNAAALVVLLVLGGGLDETVWPARWRSAAQRQQPIADCLRRLDPDAIQTLRWPLLELATASLRGLARPWRDELLRMLRGQIEIDQRVTLSEWIYYMLVRARLLPLDGTAWRGDENDADAAEAVRWIVMLLSRATGQPDLRAQKLANELVRDAQLSRTGQTHPPLDVGGLQAAVARLRMLPPLQRPLLMRRLVAFLPPEAPVEVRDFLRILALIIDCPLPRFELHGAPDRFDDDALAPAPFTREPANPGIGPRPHSAAAAPTR